VVWRVSLVYVSKREQPIVLCCEVIGERGSQSPAPDDYHALSLLQTNSVYRLALPVQRHDIPGSNFPSDPFAYYDWTDSALYEFSVEAATGTLTQVGRLVSADHSAQVPYSVRSLAQSRAFIHDDAVYWYVFNEEEILSGVWGE